MTKIRLSESLKMRHFFKEPFQAFSIDKSYVSQCFPKHAINLSAKWIHLVMLFVQTLCFLPKKNINK
jgi:hypothetical protein